jgi:hypothetical protein
MDRKRPSPVRRLLLGGAALATISAPAFASGCAAGFAPQSLVNGLRVLAVEADRPYAKPGDKVTFQMTYHDGFVNPDDPGASRQVSVLWLGGCFDPPGDAYYACYASIQNQLGSLFSSSFDPETDLPALLASGLIGIGNQFSITLPEDIVSRRPKPAGNAPHYGIAYVFFLACAGEIRPVPPEGDSEAGSFPIGCFVPGTKQRLGADSFVPGYTQVYAFADGRSNQNPAIEGLTLDDKAIPEGEIPVVGRCGISQDDRLGPPGCGRPDPFEECKSHTIDIILPKDDGLVAEIDPDAKQPDGSPLRESVWVDYFTEKGTFKADIKLVADSVEGVQNTHDVEWIAPPDPGPVRIWAVIHDARGGQRVVTRDLRVK